MNSQILTNIEKIIKNDYLPAWQNQIGIEPSALLAKIKQPTLTSDIIKAGAPVGLSGGFGFGAEGAKTPSSGAQMYEGFTIRSADMYVNLCISEKAVELGGTAGSIVDTLHGEIQGAYDAAKWNVGRSLFGNGSGVLTAMTASSASTATHKVASTKYLKEGLIVDIYAGANTEPIETVRILSIDRVGGSVTFNKAIDTNGKTGLFMTVQNSYNREITGIGAIMDLTESGTEIYGVKKADNASIVPTVIDADGDISDAIIRSGLRTALRHKNGKIDTILCGDAAFDHYTEYLRANNIRVEDKTKEIRGGFKAISFLFDNREVDIVEEQFVPDNEMWGVDSNSLEFHNIKWDFATLKDGGIFNLMEEQSVYRALLRNYGNLICSNPGGCLRIKGVGSATA